MTKIYLVRHAECIGNIENRLTGCCDFELTEKGKEQAIKLKEELKDKKIDCIYSSPYKRTIGTIKLIAEFKGIDIVTDKDLSEMNMGDYDGYQYEEVNKIDYSILHNSKKEICGIPNQESTSHVEQRIFNAIIKIAEQNKNKNILICSHGIAIEAFLRGIEGISFAVESKKYSQPNAAINEIEYENGKFKITKLG